MATNCRGSKQQSLPFLSLLRYPGGKSWLRPRVIEWLKRHPTRISVFIEPFAGGASIGLAVAQLNLADEVILVEKDPDVAAFWKVVLGPEWERLDQRIQEFRITRRAVAKLLSSKPVTDCDRAFQCLVRNRVQRAGILAPGAGLLRRGEDDNGLGSRWYPATFSRRLRAVHDCAGRIRFVEGDGIEVMRGYAKRRTAAFFVDPPYTVDGSGPGKRLYRCSDVEASSVFNALRTLHGPWLATYHDTPAIRKFVTKSRFHLREIAVRDSHHQTKRELLISS